VRTERGQNQAASSRSEHHGEQGWGELAARMNKGLCAGKARMEYQFVQQQPFYNGLGGAHRLMVAQGGLGNDQQRVRTVIRVEQACTFSLCHVPKPYG
jgi:hypothetical protein